MNPRARFAVMLTGLVLLLPITPSWGQTPVCDSPGCNPTESDFHNNTAGGTSALVSVDETAFGGFNNTAFGRAALANTTTGDGNTASGALALQFNTTGSFNTASGFNALRVNTGNNNTANGVSALNVNSTGSFNTASGYAALSSNTTGEGNTASGAFALDDNSTGFGNTAVGSSALSNSTGNKNIGIGYQAGTTLTSGNNNIFIGNQGAGNESQTIRVGTAQTSTYVAGINNAGVSGTAVLVDANGRLGITLSSARYKQDIETMASRSEGLLKLRPVTFVYKDDGAAAPHYGLIAEEVAAVYPELVTHTASGEVQTVKYHELIPMLLNELQREHHARQEDRAEMTLMRQDLSELATLRKELAELRALVGSRLEK